MPVTDAVGRPIHESLHPAFHGRTRLAVWCERVHLLERQLLEMEGKPFIAGLDVRAVIQAMKEVRKMVVNGAPWEACHCEVLQRHCPRCGGRGWLTRQESIQSPDAALLLQSG